MEMGLVELLRAAFIAATLPLIFAFIPFPYSRLSWLHGALMGFARRGKISESSSQKFTVPQRFFLHFYVVGSVWTTFLLITTWIYASKLVSLDEDPFSFSSITSYLTGSSSFTTHLTKIRQRHVAWRAIFLLLLMEFHVLRCVYESIYVFNHSPSARMHIFNYLLGLLYYIAAPLSLCCDCASEVYAFTANQVTEFIVKGENQMTLTDLEFAQFLKPLLQLGWQQWVGAAIFLWGSIHQSRCHAILGSLQEHPKQANEYVIPRGDWFEIVSSPHYLAEIVIYGGLVVASGGANLTIWLLLGFVVANLTLAAVETHRLYMQKFEDYPKNRFAIIPLVL